MQVVDAARELSGRIARACRSPLGQVVLSIVLAVLLGWLGARYTLAERPRPPAAGAPAFILSVETQFSSADASSSGPPVLAGKPARLPLSLGWSTDTLWVRLELRHTLESGPLWLEVTPPRITYASVHYRDPSGRWVRSHNGAAVPVALRDVGLAPIVLPLQLSPNDTHEIWVEVKSLTPLNFTLALHSPETFIPQSVRGQLVDLVILGGLITLGVVTLLIGLAVRKATHWMLGVRVMVISVWQLQQLGFAALVLPSAWAIALAYQTLWLALASLAATAGFYWAFLWAANPPRWVHWFYGTVLGLVGLMGFLNLVDFTDRTMIAPSIVQLAWLMLAGSIVVSVHLVLRGYVLACVALVASLAGLLMNTPPYLAVLGFIDTDVARQLVSPMPTLITSVLLFSGAAVQMLRDHHRTLERLNAVQAEQVTVLEARVAERTRQLEHARDAAEQSSASKSVFIAKVSHELRTPMHAVLGYVNLAVREDIPPRVRTMLHTARLAGRQLVAQIGDLLDFARLEREQLRLTPEPISLPALHRAVVEAAGLLARERGNTLKHRLDETMPPWVSADPRRLEQVLMILLVNAVRYTHAGRIELDMRLVDQEDVDKGKPDTVTVRFEVRDTGRGITPEALGRIFRAFERGDSVDGDGMGLGLVIAQQLLGLMGSRLEVQSVPGVGSSFAFRLRLRITPPGASSSVPEAAQFGGYRGARRKALVLDDIPTNRAYLNHLLNDAGFDVRVAESVPQALAQLREASDEGASVDICVVDQRLEHGETGWMFVSQLRAGDPRFAGCFVIMLSAAEASPPLGSEGLAGVDRFMMKPVEPNRLLMTMVELMHLDWYAPLDSGQNLPTPSAYQAPPADMQPSPQEWRALNASARAGDLTALEKWMDQFPALDSRLQQLAFALDFEGIARYASVRAKTGSATQSDSQPE